MESTARSIKHDATHAEVAVFGGGAGVSADRCASMREDTQNDASACTSVSGACSTGVFGRFDYLRQGCAFVLFSPCSQIGTSLKVVGTSRYGVTSP